VDVRRCRGHDLRPDGFELVAILDGSKLVDVAKAGGDPEVVKPSADIRRLDGNAGAAGDYGRRNGGRMTVQSESHRMGSFIPSGKQPFNRCRLEASQCQRLQWLR
jgi:hypothetical protein